MFPFVIIKMVVVRLTDSEMEGGRDVSIVIRCPSTSLVRSRISPIRPYHVPAQGDTGRIHLYCVLALTYMYTCVQWYVVTGLLSHTTHHHSVLPVYTTVTCSGVIKNIKNWAMMCFIVVGLWRCS